MGLSLLVTQFYNDERRRKSDRRGTGLTPQFPIITTQGVCVRKDRRYTPERRVSNIIVKEWRIKDSIFDIIFNTNKEKKL